ncbi:tyrosine-type recombinase/integrase [Nitriliruptoria bacterium AS10]|nr:tyrosine-type recombinase/integrase [Salsipaludibacter albus]
MSWAVSILLGRKADGSQDRAFRSGFATRRVAQQALDELRREAEAATPEAERIVVGEYLIDRWLPRTRTTEKTRVDRLQHMEAYVLPRIGDLHLDEVSGDVLNEMYDDLAVRGRTRKPDPVLGWGLSPTTIRRIHTQLNKAFNDAIRWGLLRLNPCEQADPPSTSEVKARAMAARTTYTWDQLRHFMAVAETDRLAALWHLTIVTGMRRSEVVALSWKHVDLEERMVSVVRVAVELSGTVYEHELPKSDTSFRAIELSDTDVDILRRHRKQQGAEREWVGASWRDTDLVFTSPVGGRLYPPDITKRFHALTEEARIPRARLHDLRHTNATLLIKAGVPVKVVTERLGHSTTAYTQDAYQHVMPGMQRRAAETFNARLRGHEDAQPEPEERDEDDTSQNLETEDNDDREEDEG